MVLKLTLSLIISLAFGTIQASHFEATTINIRGLILDSKTLAPLNGAIVKDAKGNHVATSDERGFFDGRLTVEVTNELDFSLNVSKAGYESISQKEHWAAMKSPVEATYYFGMKATVNGAKQFSQLELGRSSGEDMADGLDRIRKKINFENKLESAKAGNSSLYFEIESGHYLINDSGWIKLKSADALVLVNGRERLAAREINAHVKRSSVKNMTPSSRSDVDYEIYTD